MNDKKRFHISNLSGLSSQIKELDSFQFRVLYELERKIHDLSFCGSFIYDFREHPQFRINLKLSGIKYNKEVQEYYYEWEITEH